MTTPPIPITDYRARCCGTCKNRDKLWATKDAVSCDKGGGMNSIYSICMSYELEE